MHPIQLQYYRTRLGSVVGTRLSPLGVPQHVGILAPHQIWGRSVISFTPNGIIEQPVWEFAGNRQFDSVRYPGKLHWQQVVWRARTAVPLREYHFTEFNCDYFVRYCHGEKPESPQVVAFVILAAIGIGLAVAAAANG